MSRIQSNVSKGIAVLMLLYHHLFYSPKSYEMFNVDFLLVDSLAIRAARLFKLCVYIFVFITAYGITKQFSLKI